jgi:hypothetical protein
MAWYGSSAARNYGYRRIAVLVQREGYEVGTKKVRRLMKEDNLLAVRRRKFVTTTDSDHDFDVYPNLAEQLIVRDVNQLWVADITYVRLLREFVYLAVVLDAFSRRAVGWALGRSLQTSLPLAALESAIRSRQPRAGLVHHSDRGSQYASNDSKYCAIVWDKHYDAQRARGKGHQAAVRSLAFSWIRILFRCWKDRTPYDENRYTERLGRRSAAPNNRCANNVEKCRFSNPADFSA